MSDPRFVTRVLAVFLFLPSVVFAISGEYDKAQYFVLAAIFLTVVNRDK